MRFRYRVGYFTYFRIWISKAAVVVLLLPVLMNLLNRSLIDEAHFLASYLAFYIAYFLVFALWAVIVGIVFSVLNMVKHRQAGGEVCVSLDEHGMTETCRGRQQSIAWDEVGKIRIRRRYISIGARGRSLWLVTFKKDVGWETFEAMKQYLQERTGRLP